MSLMFGFWFPKHLLAAQWGCWVSRNDRCKAMNLEAQSVHLGGAGKFHSVWIDKCIVEDNYCYQTNRWASVPTSYSFFNKGSKFCNSNSKTQILILISAFKLTTQTQIHSCWRMQLKIHIWPTVVACLVDQLQMNLLFVHVGVLVMSMLSATWTMSDVLHSWWNWRSPLPLTVIFNFTVTVVSENLNVTPVSRAKLSGFATRV